MQSRGCFGEGRLEASFSGGRGRASAKIISSVAEAVKSFVGTALPSDDITIIAVRRLESRRRCEPRSDAHQTHPVWSEISSR